MKKWLYFFFPNIELISVFRLIDGAAIPVSQSERERECTWQKEKKKKRSLKNHFSMAEIRNQAAFCSKMTGFKVHVCAESIFLCKLWNYKDRS